MRRKEEKDFVHGDGAALASVEYAHGVQAEHLARSTSLEAGHHSGLETRQGPRMLKY